MVAKLRSDVLINTNPFSEVKNEKHKHNGYSDKVTLDINNKKYDVNFKDIENILDGNGALFKKRTLWEFILDLFPGSNIKQVKAFIYEFVTKNDNKAEMFKNIKSLAKTEEQWRFSTTTDFTTNENNEVVVCRSFNLYTGETVNEADKHQVFSERFTLDNYLDDLHYDNSPMKRLKFSDNAVKLTTLIKNKIPIFDTTINLTSLPKDVLNSLKYCSFKNVTFLGNIETPTLEGPVFENCYFEDCKFNNIHFYDPNEKTAESGNEKSIIGMFKGCFISKCEIKQYSCETSQVYTVKQPVNIQEKLGAYLFMQSFVQDCTIQGGSCPGSSILLSHFYNCDITGLEAPGMKFLANSFNKSNNNYIRGRDHGLVFDNCTLNYIKINSGLGEAGSGKYMFNPVEYFSDRIERRSKTLKLDDNFIKCADNINKGINSSYSNENTENNNIFFKNSRLRGADLGYCYREDRLEGCAIDSATIYSQGSLTDKKYIYMNIDGAISKEQIPNFINQADALYKDIGELEKSLPNTRLIYEKAFAELQSFLAALYNENGSFKEEFSFDIEKVNFFIFKDMHGRAQHIINNMMGRDRINFVESVIKGKISQSNAQEDLKYSEEFIRKERQESHNQFDRNLNFKFKDLVHLFDDVDIDKIELKNQLEKIKSFKEFYDSALNNFAFDFQNLAGIFKINKESLIQYYQEVKESNEGYEDILQKINELTKEHNKIVKEKAQLVSENKDNLTRNDIQRKLNNFKIDIDKIDDEIRTYQDIVQNYSREKKYKKYKKLSEIILNVITWFDKYPDIVKNITQA